MKESLLKDMSENNFLLRRQLWNAIISLFFFCETATASAPYYRKKAERCARPSLLSSPPLWLRLPSLSTPLSKLPLAAPPRVRSSPVANSPFVPSVCALCWRPLIRKANRKKHLLSDEIGNKHQSAWVTATDGGGLNSRKHLSIRNECSGCNEIAFGKWKVSSHQLADIN